MFQETTATKKILALRKRIRAVAGGTSASKTISILMVLIDIACKPDRSYLISVVSESIPHLRKGAMKDFLNIMKQHNYYEDKRWNRTTSTYTFASGTQIEFFGADSPDKLRGPRRDILYINEANNVDYNSFDQLEVRTKKLIFLDWNPTQEFWFYTDLLPSRKDDIDFITLTYKDNEALDPAIVKSIEARRGNKNWWRVYGEGQLGEAEGKIFSNWHIVSSLPFEARLEGYGLDFGYSNDPTAIVAVYSLNGGYILDEVAYAAGLSNKQIYDIFENLEKALVIADSSEPKSIDELKSLGLLILPAAKGPGSVLQGIQRIQSEKISVTSGSTNILKEYRNYMWITDKNGKVINVPEDSFNHAMDAIRYRMETLHDSRNDELVIVGSQQGWGGVEIPTYSFGRPSGEFKPKDWDPFSE